METRDNKKLFDEIPYIENDYVILKKISEEDAPVIQKMSEDMEARKYLPGFLFEYGFEDKKEAITQMYGDIFSEKKALHLGIYLKESVSELAGILEFYNYNPNWNKVSIGIRIARSNWNRKIAENATSAAMKYVMEETDVKRITIHLASENIYAARAVESLGFRRRAVRVPSDWGLEKPVLEDKYVYEKWGNISYIKIGEGDKTMVILPGLALKSTLGAASAIAENFKMFEGYSIYLFDDRDNIGENYTIRERAGDVAAEMKTLGIKDACVFGASMGGMCGQYLAIDHPELVKKLFISATISRLNPCVKKTLGSWKELALSGDLDELVDKSLRDIYSESVIKQYGEFFKGSIGEVSEDELNKFVILINAIMKVNTYDELEKIKCPVCVVWALGDRVVSPLGCQEIKAKLNCQEIPYGDEYGHAVYDEASDHRIRMYEFFEQ